MTFRMFGTASAALLLCAAQAGAQDVTAGETLYKESCRNCHGPTAKGLASFPKLTGQTEAYLVERLEQYRAGEQIGPNTALMAPNAVDLTDEEIAGIAAYIVANFD